MNANQEKPPKTAKQPQPVERRPRRARLSCVGVERSAAQCLAEMRPVPPRLRFLVSWDWDQESKTKTLRFGCGQGQEAVRVASDRTLERAEWADGSLAKMLPECAARFQNATSPITGVTLLKQCTDLFRRYVHMPDERLYSFLAVWSISTYVYPVFTHFGYLFLHSRFPRSGKTRVEEILSHLCFEATAPLNAPTASAIREFAAEGHTVILDTLERWKSKSPAAYSAAMEFLDAGFRNGAAVTKMILVRDGRWRKEALPVYAPYVLAAIGKESLAGTALDRCFVIEMRRKPFTLKTASYSYPCCDAECKPLRDNLYLWALQNADELARIYASNELAATIDALELNDRAADIWKPLLAVARQLGSAGALRELAYLASEMGRDPDAAERQRVRALVQSLRKLVNRNGAVVASTSDLVSHLERDAFRVPDHALHDMLAHWGFSQQSARLNGRPRRAWVLPDARLKEIETEHAPLFASLSGVTMPT